MPFISNDDEIEHAIDILDPDRHLMFRLLDKIIPGTLKRYLDKNKSSNIVSFEDAKRKTKRKGGK